MALFQVHTFHHPPGAICERISRLGRLIRLPAALRDDVISPVRPKPAVDRKRASHFLSKEVKEEKGAEAETQAARTSHRFGRSLANVPLAWPELLGLVQDRDDPLCYVIVRIVDVNIIDGTCAVVDPAPSETLRRTTQPFPSVENFESVRILTLYRNVHSQVPGPYLCPPCAYSSPTSSPRDMRKLISTSSVHRPPEFSLSGGS
eukprot:528477-Amorphochlora_amoeboformis.AAC.1